MLFISDQLEIHTFDLAHITCVQMEHVPGKFARELIERFMDNNRLQWAIKNPWIAEQIAKAMTRRGFKLHVEDIHNTMRPRVSRNDLLLYVYPDPAKIGVKWVLLQDVNHVEEEFL